MGHQHSAHLNPDGAGAARGPVAGGGLRDRVADALLYLRGIFIGNHAAIEFEDDFSGHHIGVGAAFDHADVEIWMGDAFHFGGDVFVLVIEGIQRAHDVHRALQGIGAAVWNRRVAHLAVDGDFHL